MRTFAGQDALPRLPVPVLEQTLEKYRASLRPLLDAGQLSRVDAIIETAKGRLQVLQKRLIDHERAQPRSWIESWWMSKVYHEWREPLIINSNWWITFRCLHIDYMREQAETVGLQRRGFGAFSLLQSRRAAGIIENMLAYKLLVDSEKIPAESTRNGALCMNQYRLLFGVTRIPDMPGDTIVSSFPCKATHIIVLVRDQIYKCEVCTRDGTAVPLHVLEKQLQAIVHDVQQLSAKNMMPSVCLLTAEHRDTWTKARKHLLSLHKDNQTVLHVIESALFAVSLDDFAPGPQLDEQHRHIAHGITGHNRWFDKSLNIIVASNGQAGCNGEHSPLDALTNAVMFDYVVQNEPSLAAYSEHEQTSINLDLPQRLQWHTDNVIQKYINEADINTRKIIAASDIGLLVFDEYGNEFIKKAKMSPDAYVQMIIQLTYYRMHKHVCPTYETAGVRLFKHGRTETCRTLSVDSKKWVERMDCDDISSTEKLSLLRTAMDTHIKYITEASQGRGVDRHLFGLRMCLREGETCALFDDPSYWGAQEWLLSTSGLSVNNYKSYWGTGFGSVYPNGYGINYFAGPHQIQFGIESKYTSTETSTDVFRLHLLGALRDVRLLIEDLQTTNAANSSSLSNNQNSSTATIGVHGETSEFPRVNKL